MDDGVLALKTQQCVMQFKISYSMHGREKSTILKGVEKEKNTLRIVLAAFCLSSTVHFRTLLSKHYNDVIPDTAHAVQ